MKVYDFEHHGYSKAIMDYLHANTNGFPRINEENTFCYNDTFLCPMGMTGFNSTNTILQD